VVVDEAVARMLRLHKFPISDNSNTLVQGSYDNYCNYGPNQLRRFQHNHPNLTYLVKDMTQIIPSVHVRNHKDSCKYLYGSAYKLGVGHFVGEIIKAFWPYTNARAGQTRQMSNGRRQDTHCSNFDGWNWMKLARLRT
jgi:hypothetical protein